MANIVHHTVALDLWNEITSMPESGAHGEALGEIEPPPHEHDYGSS